MKAYMYSIQRSLIEIRVNNARLAKYLRNFANNVFSKTIYEKREALCSAIIGKREKTSFRTAMKFPHVLLLEMCFYARTFLC